MSVVKSVLPRSSDVQIFVHEAARAQRRRRDFPHVSSAQGVKRLRRDDPFADGESDQSCDILDVELEHEPSAIGVDA